MSSRCSARLVLSLAATLGVSLVSCSDNPTAPSTSASPSGFVRLELVAPQEIAFGQSVQLRANAIKSNGRVEDVTSQTQWQAQSFPTTSVLALTATGVVTGVTGGRSVITARFVGFSADATIFVLPKGTFRVVGKVTEAGAGVENATVTVLSGVGQALSSLTGHEGDYELYGVAGPVEIGASKDGYFDSVQQIDVTAHAALTFQLTPKHPWDDFRGEFALTITGGDCSYPFPESAKVRVYTATVSQEGARLKVSLSGATFFFQGNAFEGMTTPTGDVEFRIRPVSIWDYDATDIFERLDDGTQLIIGGIVVARHTPTGLSGQASTDYPGCCNGYMRLNGASGVCTIQKFDMVRH